MEDASLKDIAASFMIPELTIKLGPGYLYHSLVTGNRMEHSQITIYSVDFSKIREMRKQNKRERSRASVGNEEGLINPTAPANAKLVKPSNDLHLNQDHSPAMPVHLDCFGWCTWDAFYQDVNPEGIREGLESFAKGGVLPRLLIINDGWQDTCNEFQKDGESPQEGTRFAKRLVAIKENHKKLKDIFEDSINNLLLGEIVVPDWDMFHSKHDAAGFHGAARAVWWRCIRKRQARKS